MSREDVVMGLLAQRRQSEQAQQASSSGGGSSYMQARVQQLLSQHQRGLHQHQDQQDWGDSLEAMFGWPGDAGLGAMTSPDPLRKTASSAEQFRSPQPSSGGFHFGTGAHEQAATPQPLAGSTAGSRQAALPSATPLGHGGPRRTSAPPGAAQAGAAGTAAKAPLAATPGPGSRPASGQQARTPATSRAGTGGGGLTSGGSAGQQRSTPGARQQATSSAAAAVMAALQQQAQVEPGGVSSLHSATAAEPSFRDLAPGRTPGLSRQPAAVTNATPATALVSRAALGLTPGIRSTRRPGRVGGELATGAMGGAGVIAWSQGAAGEALAADGFGPGADPHADLEGEALLTSMNALLDEVAASLGLAGAAGEAGLAAMDEAGSRAEGAGARVAVTPSAAARQTPLRLQHQQATPSTRQQLAPSSSYQHQQQQQQQQQRRGQGGGSPSEAAAGGLGRSAQEEGSGGSPRQQRSLAELEAMLSQAMRHTGLNTDPRSARPGDGGPFDISDLWAGGGGGERDTLSASEATTLTGGGGALTGAGGRGADLWGDGGSEATSGHRDGAPAAGGARGGRGGTSRVAAGQQAWERVQQRQRQALSHPRAASAPRQRPSAAAARSPVRRRSASPPSPSSAAAPRPIVNPSSRRMVAASYPDDPQMRLEQLAVPKVVMQAAKQAAARREEEEQLLAECTFAPRIGRAPVPITPRLKAMVDLPVHERLYHAGPAWLAKRDQALRARQEAELAECTFRPLTNHSRGKGSWSMGHSSSRSPARPASAGPALGVGKSVGGGVDRGRPSSAVGQRSRHGGSGVGEGGGGRLAGRGGATSAGRTEGNSLSVLPLYERVGDVLRQKSEKLANARLSLELGGGSVGAGDCRCKGGAEGRAGAGGRGSMGSGGGWDGVVAGAGATFKPQVCAKSEQLVAQKRAREAAEAAAAERQQALLQQQQQKAQWDRQLLPSQPDEDHQDQQQQQQGQEQQGQEQRQHGNAVQRQYGNALQQQPGPEPACERLYQKAKKAARSAELSDVVASQRDQDCTFAPAITNRSRELVQRSQHLPSSFLERQAHLAELAAQRKAVYRSLVENAECSFKPKLTTDGEYRGSASTSGDQGSSFGGSPGRSRVAKLAYEDVRRSQALKEALEQHYYGQLTFSPEVNPKSRALVAAARRRSLCFSEDPDSGGGNGGPIANIWGGDAAAGAWGVPGTEAMPNRHARHVAASVAADEDLRDCTFRPALNPRSLDLARKVQQRRGSVLDAASSALDQRLSREQRLQEAKALREYEELKECTFTPELNARSRAAVASGAAAAPAGPATLAALSGVARHLEQLAMARRRKEEQRKVEDRVWWRTPRGSTALFTVPQPFSFDQGEQGPSAGV